MPVTSTKVSKEVHCAVCSILIGMDFRLQLQAKFEGYLIVLPIPLPHGFLEAEAHPRIPKIDVGFSLLVVSCSCHRHAPGSCHGAGKAVAKPFSCARRTSHSGAPSEMADRGRAKTGRGKG